MFTIKQRIAIARIISDMIKADNIIDESEIEMLNRFKQVYFIDSNILSKARHVKFSQAVSDLKYLKPEEKIEIFKAIQNMAKADGVCVPREAMLLLALRYAFGVRESDRHQYSISNDAGTKLISCPTGEASITSQYVIYIEGKYNDAENERVKKDLELNVLKLRHWGFDFIYIPSLIEEFQTMNAEYVKDVVNYMAPELSESTIDQVYNRLLQMDTPTFCNHVLAEKLHVEEVKNTEPSLFVNIGTSIVPYCATAGKVECYTEFLCIPLKDGITSHVNDFINAYQGLVSSYATTNATDCADNNNRFKYFGFYKAMFDFLVKAEPKESHVLLHTDNAVLKFPKTALEVKLSPQEAALYKLILELTYNHELKGLPTYYTKKYDKEIREKYLKIYRKSGCEFPDNIDPIISRIKAKMNKQLGGLANLEEFLPKKSNGKCVIFAAPERIKICNDYYGKVVDFSGYQWE
jgi:uncharacterized tellurite resistance protein B-like protein